MSSIAPERRSVFDVRDGDDLTVPEVFDVPGSLAQARLGGGTIEALRRGQCDAPLTDGLWRMMYLPKHNEDLPNDDYSDLSLTDWNAMR